MTRFSLFAAQGLVGLVLAACGPQPAPLMQPMQGPAPETVSRTGAERVVSRWNREARQADQEAVQDTVALLRNARVAMAEPRGVDRAMEMLERAESRLLTRDMLAGTEGEAMNEGPQARIAASRRALGSGNRAGAVQALDEAMAMLQRR